MALIAISIDFQQHSICDLQVTIYNLQFTIYKLQVTIYKLQVTIYKLQVTISMEQCNTRILQQSNISPQLICDITNKYITTVNLRYHQ